METRLPVVYFNNCHNRDHVRWFGSGAFFDLGITGRQGLQARDLHPGQLCVVAERSAEDELVFDWYSFSYEALLQDEHGIPDRVFYGRHFASETMAKKAAASSALYAPLFRSNGHLKVGSVFRKAILPELIPYGFTNDNSQMGNSDLVSQAGAGFGDPGENKLVESAAVRAVVTHYLEGGWSVRSVERDKCGFDLECAKGDMVEQVEVKGIRGASLCFMITAGEVKQAQTNPNFFLVVVTLALTGLPTITKFTGAEFVRQFDLVAIQYRATLKP